MNFIDQIDNIIEGALSTIIVNDFDSLNISDIDEGILIVYATWSGQARMNFLATVDFLKNHHYDKKVIIVDTDCFSSEQYVTTFGRNLGGAGEIFVIKNGHITEKYFGYSSFKDFSNNHINKS